MRPVLLRMTAFGPFPTTEEIRFEDLGSNPLFLINGPTGSGKTTILDAICFALYGKSTGDEREGSQMRSDLADPELLTEVLLVFDLSGKRYRIKRIPEQQRPKSRGEGFTSQSAQAEFHELLPAGEERLIVSSKITEATAEIELLTGLNADQFRQVIALPQGKFRQLLMAESKDREQIFSKLFQTQVYKKLEDSLKRQASEVRREVEKQKQLALGILKGVDLENLEALSVELESITPQWQQAQQEKQLTDKRYLEAAQQFQAAQNLLEQFTRLTTTREQLKALLLKKTELDLKRRQLKNAELAQKLFPVQKEVTRCQADLASASQKQEQTGQEKNNSRKKLEEAEQELKKVDPLSKELDEVKQELTRLNGFKERATKLAAIEKNLQAIEQAEKTAVSRLQVATDQLGKTSQEREQAEESVQQLQQLQAGLSQKQLTQKELADHLSVRKNADDKSKQLALLQKKLEKAEVTGKKLADNLQQDENDLKVLELKWHQGQAAILAKELETGAPCPVCGSLDHPLPAQSAVTLPTETELEQARELRQQASEKLTTARETYQQLKNEERLLQQEINQAIEKLGLFSELPLTELRKKYDEQTVTVNELIQQQEQIKALLAQVAKLKAAELALRKTADAEQLLVTEKKAQLASVMAQVETAREELPEAFRKAGELEKSITQSQAKIREKGQLISGIRKLHQDCLGDWKTTSAAHQAAIEFHKISESKFQETRDNWKTTLTNSEFDSEADYTESLLEEAIIELLKQEIEEYDTQLGNTRGALEQQESALTGKKQPDLKTLDQILQQKSAEKGTAETKFQQLDKRLSQLQSVEKKLKQAMSSQVKLEEHYALVGTLSDVANGQTGDKISLQRFVLSVLLEDVLVEASHRLKLMSKGRYQLLRKEDRTKGNKASGLDLEVEDGYSGKVRPVATLSGGESFMAALAMALGLSDVVQAYSGGIRLETLFIDEGFGSLDPESLDLAIRTLIDLQSSGRMIGIISHVSDLREQLPTRLDITAGRQGSQITLVRS